MRVGLKARGDRRAKVYSVRHGHGCKRSCNAQEKAIETGVRRQGKKECKSRED